VPTKLNDHQLSFLRMTPENSIRISGRIRSAPSRRPETGRSNISNVASEDGLLTNRNRPKTHKYELLNEYKPKIHPNDLIVTEADKEKLNNTLHIFRPFTPEITEYDANIKNPPILPKSTEPTIPPLEPHRKKYLKPSICPEGWIEKNQKPATFDKSGFKTSFDDNEKREYCKKFVERNRDKLWKYDTNYVNKTPRTVYKELVGEYFYLNKMTTIHHRENMLKASSSDAVLSCLSDGNKPTKHVIIDPYTSTLHTSRDERKLKMEKLIAPAISPDYMLTKYRRGYKHTFGYGNFSNYNSILKVHEGSSIKR